MIPLLSKSRFGLLPDSVRSNNPSLSESISKAFTIPSQSVSKQPAGEENVIFISSIKFPSALFPIPPFDEIA